MSSLCSSNNKALSIAASVVINPSIVPMFGWIIPEPLHMPAIVTVFPSISTSTAASFGFVSVVRIAQDASSSLCLSAFNSGTNLLIPSLITSIGSCCPITPVEPTTTSSGLISNNFATSFASVTTFSYPCAPVHAFAIPVLITTALTASCSSTIFFPHKTGAAFTTFWSCYSGIDDLHNSSPSLPKPYGNIGTNSNPSVSFNPNIRFMFCTACPAAPFTRLSMAPIMIIRFVRLSILKLTST